MSDEAMSPDVRPLGVGIIGLGNWSYQLGQAFARVRRATLLACYTRTAEKRQKFASTFGCKAASSPQELFETPGLQAVMLATPAHAHQQLALSAMERGLHVFVEKPMALSVVEATHLLRASETNGVTFMVGHEMRRLGSIRAAKRLLARGALGQVVSAVGVMTLRGRFEPDNWRCHHNTNRGGALMQLGIHQIENLNYLLGRPVRVRGAFGNAVAPNGVYDLGSAIITYEGGVEATVVANYVSPSSQRLSLYGTEANLHQIVDMRVWPNAALVDQQTQFWIEDRQDHHHPSIEPRDVLVEQIDDFVTSIQEGTQPETGGKEGLWAVAVVEAALRSFETGRPVEPGQLIENLS